MGATIGVTLAAQRLAALLAEPRYRRRWQPHSSVRRGELSRAAVAAVLDAHLVETGEVGWDHQPRSLENRVGRALNGDRLSDATLELFIAAFEMTREHADELRALVRGRPLRDQLVVATQLDGEAPLPRRTVRTLQVAEHHEIGPDRSPRQHVTRLLLEAVEPTDRHHYAFDTPHAAVTVLTGGTPLRAYRVTGTQLFAVEIVLTEPMLAGQTTHLEYRTAFCYPAPPVPEFRKIVTASMRHVALTLRFDPSCLPREVSCARWADAASTDPTDAAPVRLVGGQTSQEVVPDGECVIGWHWTW
ncbi:hypothetical protein [Modestobacter excelsi]|uniref:hypothetical protein n=1 Tax=Modestobacter excelsi TaxID=2213161 RepID=UPI00110D1B07|nr:hypothetical protein [Modestobacter excelsi]